MMEDLSQTADWDTTNMSGLLSQEDRLHAEVEQQKEKKEFLVKDLFPKTDKETTDFTHSLGVKSGESNLSTANADLLNYVENGNKIFTKEGDISLPPVTITVPD